MGIFVISYSLVSLENGININVFRISHHVAAFPTNRWRPVGDATSVETAVSEMGRAPRSHRGSVLALQGTGLDPELPQNLHLRLEHCELLQDEPDHRPARVTDLHCRFRP